MTGGAFGSMIAQFFRLTAAERKTLLVAGAAGGMAATFAAPVASTLLGVELLLFEWKPRSLIPVAMASATAALLRPYIIGPGPMFPMAAQAATIGPLVLLGCVLAGLLAGALSAVVTLAVYAAEDGFRLLPIHWMWWPAIGGVVVGIGGLIFPEALGVGYNVIAALLRGDVVRNVIIGILVVKSIIWAVSLGSGTSGGVLAPLLMMGGALGGLEAGFLPAQAAGFWPLVSMSAVLGGTMRIPLTAVIFSIELTHNLEMMLPLLVSTIVAHGFTVLTMRRSILTEKVARRGYHLTCEYAVDPLEVLFVRDVMRTNVVVLAPEVEANKGAAAALADGAGWQRLYPVADSGRRLLGVLNRKDLEKLAARPGTRRLVDAAHPPKAVAFPDEPLSVVVYRMAGTAVTSMPVVERADPHKLAGMVALDDLLKARARHLEEERRRERALRIRFRRPRRQPGPVSMQR
jgi:CBS domain-containing protein